MLHSSLKRLLTSPARPSGELLLLLVLFVKKRILLPSGVDSREGSSISSDDAPFGLIPVVVFSEVKS